MFKKSIALLIVAAMSLSLLAACGGSSGGGTAATPQPAAPAQQASPQTADAPATTAEEIAAPGIWTGSYPMNAMHIDLTIWMPEGPTLNRAFAEWQDSPFHSQLGPMAGVNLSWQFMPAGETNQAQQLNLLIASGDYPDIMFSAHIQRDAEMYIDDGVFLDLSPYIAEWSPNWYGYTQRMPALGRAFRTDSGRYYGYGFFREGGGWNDTYQGPLVRYDWLAEQGLPTPVTIGDWDRTLRAFKDAYGAVLTSAWGSRWRFGSNICGAFGAYGGKDFRIYADRNGKVHLGQVEPAWRDYITQLNIWWSDGLIDQDLMSNDDAAVRAKALNGETGLAFSSMGQLTNWVRDAEADGIGSDWGGLDYPEGNDGTKSMVFGGYGIGGTAACISSRVTGERLEAAMRLMDYAYSPEGFIYWNFGIEGVSFNFDANGNPQYSDLVLNDPDGINDAIDKYAGTAWNGPCIQATALLYQKNHEKAIAANDLWFYSNEPITAYYTLPRGFGFTTDESIRVEEIQGPMLTYIEEMAVSFMTGSQSIADFDNFVATVERMGLAELLTIYQAAYDRYINR
jgi:putative aldouronate transport system substrate-binding protein